MPRFKYEATKQEKNMNDLLETVMKAAWRKTDKKEEGTATTTLVFGAHRIANIEEVARFSTGTF